MASPLLPKYTYFLLSTPSPYVIHVEINRPQKLNAFIEPMWLELRTIFTSLSHSPDVRAIVLSGAGEKAFTTGLDVQAAAEAGVAGQGKDGGERDTARIATGIRRHIEEFQDCISSIERCEKPVICILHGHSLGLALDISTASDIRLCASQTRFAVAEVTIGLAADIGTLSRLPKIIGSSSFLKEICYTGRPFTSSEALTHGLVSAVLPTKQDAVARGIEMAKEIAARSPVAVQGTKELLNHARDNKVSDSLRYTGVWNSAMIQTGDVERAMLSGLKRTKPTFEKL